MIIEQVRVETLTPNPKNRNKHPENQIERLVELIKYQGFRQPIVVSNRTGFIVTGHGRLEAAKRVGLDTVPVIYQDFANEEAEYAFGLSDNAIAAWADLDLSGINGDLPDFGPDFDIDLLGIEDFVLDISEIDLPDLPDGDKEPFEQITFTLHVSQAEQVRRALTVAKDMGAFESENQNSNGNAIARVCETFLTAHG